MKSLLEQLQRKCLVRDFVEDHLKTYYFIMSPRTVYNLGFLTNMQHKLDVFYVGISYICCCPSQEQ